MDRWTYVEQVLANLRRVTPDERAAIREELDGHIEDHICDLLELGYDAKLTGRSGSCVLYFKQSEIIEDFLTLLGAPVCAMDVMQAKMEKDLRNGVNRRVNCETANLTKVVDAAQEQISAIRYLKEREQWETLPEKLRQSAQLRMENPEATLQELAEMMEPPVSKSAMNHRMRKLVQLARQ